MGARMRLSSSAAVCAAVLIAVGCGGDELAPSSGAPTTTAPEVSGSPSPTTSESPSVAPATGPVLKMDVAEVNAPAGWEHEEQLVPLEDGARGPEGRMSIFERPSFGSSLDELAELPVREGSPFRGELKRLPDTEIAGVAAYHLLDKGPSEYLKFVTYEGFAAEYRDSVVEVVLQLDRDVPKAERERIRDEVLASFKWK